MCGRLSIAVSKEDLSKYLKENYDITVLPETIELPRFNVAPNEDLVSLISDGEKFRVGLLKWGFIPEYKKDDKQIIINTRSETIDRLFSFKKSFSEKRCVILADGFFEWERLTSTKIPYRFTLKNRKIFGFAGLWSTFTDSKGKKTYTTTIITTKANTLMSEIHDRMPVILDEKTAKFWLDPRVKDLEALKKVLIPYDLEDMELYEVSPKVNNARYKEPDAIKQIKKSAL